MKKLILAIGVLALPALVATNCGGPNPTGTDAGNKDSGTSNATDSGSNDAGNNNSGLGTYCSTADGGAACPTGMNCYTIGGTATGGFCAPPCTTTCAQGSCESAGSVSVCMQTCASAAGCPTNDVCAQLSATTSVCLPDCRAHSDLCGSGSACDQSFGICTPTGNQTYGQPCGGTNGNCQAGLTCLQAQGAPSGWCSQVCSSANPCPSNPAGAQCVVSAKGTTSTYCGWLCTLGDAGSANQCPTGLTCQPAGTQGLCE